MLRHPRAVALAISNRRVIWLRLCGAIAIAGLIFASLLLPAEWERLRTGHWLMEHFLAYFVASLVICLGWPRPFVVAGALAVAAAILETLQGLTPNHSASVDLVMAGAAGALTAALIAKLTMVAWSRRARWRLAFRRRAEGVSDDVGKARTKHSERIAMASVLEAFANHRLIWFRLCGVLAMVAIVFASLMLPPTWEQMRTGHWFVEHFLGYFVASSIILLGWPKPLVVGLGLATTAVILEALQGLSPNHSVSAISVIGGVTGALTAAILAKLIAVASRRRPHG